MNVTALNTKVKTTLKHSALLMLMVSLSACNESEKPSEDISEKKITQLVSSEMSKNGVFTFEVDEKTQQKININKLVTCASSTDSPTITKKTFSDKVSNTIKNNITINDGTLTVNFTKYNVPDNTVDTVTGSLTVDCKKPDGTLYNDPKNITIKLTITDGDDADSKKEPESSNNTVNTYQPYTQTNNQGTTSGTSQQTQPVTPDTTAPVLNTTNKTFTTTVGTALTLATVTATDNVDGTITVTKTGTVDFNTAGTYKVTYTAKDTANNVASVEHTYVVNPTQDTTAPVLSTSTKTFTTTAGTPLTLATVTATDAVDGTVTVTKTGTVDFNTAGTYKVTYSAKDSANNVASAEHTYVVEAKANTAPVLSNPSALGDLEFSRKLTNISLDISDDDLSKVTWELTYSHPADSGSFSQSSGTGNTLKGITFTANPGGSTGWTITAKVTDSGSGSVQNIIIYKN